MKQRFLSFVSNFTTSKIQKQFFFSGYSKYVFLSGNYSSENFKTYRTNWSEP